MVSLVSVGKVGDGLADVGLEPDMLAAGYVKEKGKSCSSSWSGHFESTCKDTLSYFCTIVLGNQCIKQ